MKEFRKLISPVCFILSFCLTVVNPFTSNGQDCDIKKENDSFTGQNKVSTGFFRLKGALLSIDANPSGFDYFFVIQQPAGVCFEENAEVTLVFEGDRRSRDYRITGETNCEGIFHLIFRGARYTNSTVNQMITKKLVSFIFTERSGKKITISLDPEQQEKIMKYSACVAAEAKTL